MCNSILSKVYKPVPIGSCLSFLSNRIHAFMLPAVISLLTNIRRRIHIVDMKYPNYMWYTTMLLYNYNSKEFCLFFATENLTAWAFEGQSWFFVHRKLGMNHVFAVAVSTDSTLNISEFFQPEKNALKVSTIRQQYWFQDPP